MVGPTLSFVLKEQFLISAIWCATGNPELTVEKLPTFTFSIETFTLKKLSSFIYNFKLFYIKDHSKCDVQPNHKLTYLRQTVFVNGKVKI